MLREGELTQGVWLPIALATLVRVVMQLTSAMVSKEADFKVPKLSEVLGWFELPVMAEAADGDEKEAEAIKMFQAVKNLAKRQAK